MICNGCGGRVGFDCFNPQECEWIAQDMQRRAHEAKQYWQWAAEQAMCFQEQEFERDRFEATAAGVA